MRGVYSRAAVLAEGSLLPARSSGSRAAAVRRRAGRRSFRARSVEHSLARERGCGDRGIPRGIKQPRAVPSVLRMGGIEAEEPLVSSKIDSTHAHELSLFELGAR